MKDYMGKDTNVLIPPIFRRIKLRYEMSKNSNPEWVDEYSEELEYIKKYSRVQFMPYPFIEKYKASMTEGYFDQNRRLPYIIHNQKRLYFPSKMTIKEMKKVYKRLLLEQDNKSPHKYFEKWENMRLEDSIFVDCGAAEGIISLDIVEHVKQIYIIECSKDWIEPLKATFEPWKEKIVLIEKSLGNIDNKNVCKLDTILNGKNGESIIIKMDIEGAEKEALEGAKKILVTNKQNIHLSVCTYHLQEDFKLIKSFLEELGYQVFPSQGFVLWYSTTNFQYPYFRKCLIRAHGK